MRMRSITMFGALLSLAIFGGCSSGSSNSGQLPLTGGSSCQKLCQRAGQANAACAPSDCVDKCETTLPKCDAEYRAFVDCMANAQMIGCETTSGKPVAINECDAENQAMSNCLFAGTGGGSGTGGTGASGGMGGSSSGGSGGAGGSTGPCDPLKASCVACGSESCDAPEACCWSDGGPSCGASGSCTSAPEASCDGNEDCSGGQCCVAFLVGQDGIASSGKAVCSAGGGSVCCSATPGSSGCAGDSAVSQCVCAQDDYCCTSEWDSQCAGEVTQFGCGSCGAGCDFSNGSTGTGSSIKSVACRTGADCAGVSGQFGVPYSECCKSKNFGVGACVSQTFASVISDAGGSCN
jgi:hypothetical protein